MKGNVIRPKDNAEWLEYRKNGIGSSEVATILGVNPYETPYQLWLRKRGETAPKEDNFLMRAGHYFEEGVAQCWSFETKKEIIKASQGDWLIQDKEKPYFLASPDRTYWIDENDKSPNKKGILECKTTQKTILDPNDVPNMWFCQLQWQLFLSGYNQGAIAWLSQGRNFNYKMCDRSDELCEYMAYKVEEFWLKNVIGGEEPALVSSNDVLAKFPKSEKGKEIVADNEVRNIIKQIKSIKSDIKSLEEQEEELTEKIKVYMSDSEVLIDDVGSKLCTWIQGADTARFDTKKFKEDHADLYPNYTNVVKGARRFLIK